jgi:D-lactate dehydrogenase
MRVAVFDAHDDDRKALVRANQDFGYELVYFNSLLSKETASQAADFDVVCVSMEDRLDAATLQTLKGGGVRLVALRCDGYQHVDLIAAAQLDLRVVRVPEYSQSNAARVTLENISAFQEDKPLQHEVAVA